MGKDHGEAIYEYRRLIFLAYVRIFNKMKCISHTMIHKRMEKDHGEAI